MPKSLIIDMRAPGALIGHSAGASRAQTPRWSRAATAATAVRYGRVRVGDTAGISGSPIARASCVSQNRGWVPPGRGAIVLEQKEIDERHLVPRRTQLLRALGEM